MDAPARCRNCDALLHGRWCHACGQDSRDPLRAFGALLEEFLDSALSLDSRLVRTLRVLVTRPGHLTDEFVAGRRARYLGPVRLYLLASVVYVATYAAFGGEASLTYLAGGGDIVAGHGELTRLQRWLSLLLLLLMPLAAFVAAVTFRRRGVLLVQHSVWVLHVTSFTLLAWSVGCALSQPAFRWWGGAGEIGASMAANLVVFFYGFRAARDHYRRTDLDAFWRVCAYGLLSAAALRGIVLAAMHMLGD